MAKKEEKPQEASKPGMPELPPEVKEKLEKLKGKLDKFKAEVLDKFKEYIVGMALLPPEKPPTEEEKKRLTVEEVRSIEERSKFINALILVNDSDVQKMTQFELKDKMYKILDKTAADIDPLL